MVVYGLYCSCRFSGIELVDLFQYEEHAIIARNDMEEYADKHDLNLNFTVKELPVK